MLENIRYNLFNNWNIIRWIRFAISILIVVQAIQLQDILFGFLGVFFMFQALTNTGCCANNNCATSKENIKNLDDVGFIEVKNK